MTEPQKQATIRDLPAGEAIRAIVGEIARQFPAMAGALQPTTAGQARGMSPREPTHARRLAGAAMRGLDTLRDTIGKLPAATADEHAQKGAALMLCSSVAEHLVDELFAMDRERTEETVFATEIMRERDDARRELADVRAALGPRQRARANSAAAAKAALGDVPSVERPAFDGKPKRKSAKAS